MLQSNLLVAALVFVLGAVFYPVIGHGASLPDLSAFPRDVRSSMEAACNVERYAAGPAAYARCLQKQVAEFEGLEPSYERQAPRQRVESAQAPPELVARIQQQLAFLGYDVGPADGILGPRTIQAILEFEAARRLPQTGRATPDLLAVLQTQYPSEDDAAPDYQAPASAARLDRLPKPDAVLPPTSGRRQGQPMTPTEVYRQVADSVFVVLASRSLESMQQGEGSQGSAVAIAPDLLLTNCHVLTGGFIVLMQKGDAFLAEAVAGDPATDRCVLRANDRRDLRPATVRASSDLEVGDKLFTVGSPNGLERTLGEGLVSGLRVRDGVPLVQTTAQISPGSSGGGLFDQQGNLVGITSFLLKDAQALNFAIGVEAFWARL